MLIYLHIWLEKHSTCKYDTIIISWFLISYINRPSLLSTNYKRFNQSTAVIVFYSHILITYPFFFTFYVKLQKLVTLKFCKRLYPWCSEGKMPMIIFRKYLHNVPASQEELCTKTLWNAQILKLIYLDFFQ